MVRSKDKDSSTAQELRRQAEELLQQRAARLPAPLSQAETQRLVHELEVHQIELEMQNAELRRARDEAERSSELYTHLYEFAPVGYFTLDRAGIIKAVNLSGASLLGSERARLLGRQFRDFLPTGTRPVFSDFLGQVFGRQGKESCEMPLTKEGNQPLFVQLEALADASGEECCIAAIDITERRLVESELAGKRGELEELNRSLELRIAKAVDELRRKDEMLILQDRLSVMGEMINNIAHQWNQPLNTLGLVVQQLPLAYDAGECCRELLDGTSRKAMELIRHMSRTIEDFRSLFRVDKETITFSVNQVIARTLSLIEKTLQDQEIEVALRPEGDPMATGFPNEYSQVLLNILLNARDALLERKVDQPLISIHAFAEGGKSVVTISDNAGGIPEEVLDRLFDAYFTTKEKGTGIGLFMSRTIIEKSMKGSLTVRNIGGGAQFRIEV